MIVYETSLVFENKEENKEEREVTTITASLLLASSENKKIKIINICSEFSEI